MKEDRHNSMLLYVEQEVLSKIDTTKIIHDFARKNLEKHLCTLINDKYIVRTKNLIFIHILTKFPY